ncbi:MAG: hypothetical protein NXI14_14405 [bacterium]|nr:hypothetical protein [bacterium]
MEQQSLLPLDGDLTLNEVISAYKAHLLTPIGSACRFNELKNLITLCIWVEAIETADAFLDDVLRFEQEDVFRHEGGREAFEARCITLIRTPELVAETVASQIASLKVGKLPVSNLTA